MEKFDEKRNKVVMEIYRAGLYKIGFAVPKHIDAIMESLKDNPNPSNDEICKAILSYFFRILDNAIEESKKEYTEEEWANIEAQAEKEAQEERLQNFSNEMSQKKPLKS